MKLEEILNKLDKSNKNEDYVDIEELCEELNIQYFYNQNKNEKIKSYWISHHICTDTWVGIKAYFFEDEFIFLTQQTARNSSPDFYWTHKDAREKVRNYILSLQDEEEDDFYTIDLTFEIPDYQVSYASQIINQSVIYNNELYEVKKRLYYVFDKPDLLVSKNNEEIWIYAKDVIIPFNFK